jgi:hypothetical protein
MALGIKWGLGCGHRMETVCLRSYRMPIPIWFVRTLHMSNKSSCVNLAGDNVTQPRGELDKFDLGSCAVVKNSSSCILWDSQKIEKACIASEVPVPQIC